MMRDDKGNPFKKGTILIDTGRHTENIWDYYYVVDKNTCIPVAKNMRIRTLEELKEDGYIKIQVHAKDVPRKIQGENAPPAQLEGSDGK